MTTTTMSRLRLSTNNVIKFNYSLVRLAFCSVFCLLTGVRFLGGSLTTCTHIFLYIYTCIYILTHISIRRSNYAINHHTVNNVAWHSENLMTMTRVLETVSINAYCCCHILSMCWYIITVQRFLNATL